MDKEVEKDIDQAVNQATEFLEDMIGSACKWLVQKLHKEDGDAQENRQNEKHSEESRQASR